MDEVKTNEVENLPVLEEVPEGATLIAEVDGEFYRVKGEGVGGSGLDVVVVPIPLSEEMDADGYRVSTCPMPFSEIEAAVMRGALCFARFCEIVEGKVEYFDSILCPFHTFQSITGENVDSAYFTQSDMDASTASAGTIYIYTNEVYVDRSGNRARYKYHTASVNGVSPD